MILKKLTLVFLTLLGLAFLVPIHFSFASHNPLSDWYISVDSNAGITFHGSQNYFTFAIGAGDVPVGTNASLGTWALPGPHRCQVGDGPLFNGQSINLHDYCDTQSFSNPPYVYVYIQSMTSNYDCGTGNDCILVSKTPVYFIGTTTIPINNSSTAISSTTIFQPQDSFYAPVNLSSWGVRLKDNLATTSLKIYVVYGTFNTSQYSDSFNVFMSTENSQYFVPITSGVDFTRGSTATQDWYAQAYVYNDCNNNGNFNCLVDTSAQIHFLYNKSSTAIYSDNNLLFVASTSTTTPNPSGIGRWSQFWSLLQTKAPFGYVTILNNIVQNYATTSATSTTYFGGFDLSVLDSSVSKFLDPFKAGVSVLILILTLLIITKSITWINTA